MLIAARSSKILQRRIADSPTSFIRIPEAACLLALSAQNA
jgi:hypothetical protein